MGLFRSSRQMISEDDLADLHGKVVIVTGSNTGIGYATIPFLARRGAKVYMAAPDEQACKAAIASLKEAGLGDGSVHWLKLELSDPRLAKSAAQEILSKENRLDILINNAAKSVGPFAMTKDGLIETMVINYLSPFVFTETLLPLMIKTSKEEGSDVRIINLTSSTHVRVAPLSLKGKDSFNVDYGDTTTGRLMAYGLSKLACILHIKHLQRRLDAQRIGIVCMAVDPGMVRTENLKKWISSMSFLLGTAAGLLSPFFFWPAREGAMSPAYAAASPEVRVRWVLFKGSHLVPVGIIAEASGEAQNDRLANELYDTSVDVLKELGV